MAAANNFVPKMGLFEYGNGSAQGQLFLTEELCGIRFSRTIGKLATTVS